MGKGVLIEFKNPTNEGNLHHIEIWRDSGSGMMQYGSDIPFVAGTAVYSVPDNSPDISGGLYITYNIRSYNDKGGDIRGIDYNDVEHTIQISNIVEDVLTFTTLSMTEAPAEIYKNNAANYKGYGVSTTGYDGDFSFEITLERQDNWQGFMIGVSTHGINAMYSDPTNFWNLVTWVSTSSDRAYYKINAGTTRGCTNTKVFTGGDNSKYRITRTNDIVNIYHNDELMQHIGLLQGTLFMHISTTLGNYIEYPHIIHTS